LESFSVSTSSPRKEVREVADKFKFSSFSAVYDCAEIDVGAKIGSKNSYCPCSDPDCLKVHLVGTLSAKIDEVTKAAKLFRAQVLNEGFTKFLEWLVRLPP